MTRTWQVVLGSIVWVTGPNIVAGVVGGGSRLARLETSYAHEDTLELVCSVSWLNIFNPAAPPLTLIQGVR